MYRWPHVHVHIGHGHVSVLVPCQLWLGIPAQAHKPGGVVRRHWPSTRRTSGATKAIVQNITQRNHACKPPCKNARMGVQHSEHPATLQHPAARHTFLFRIDTLLNSIEDIFCFPSSSMAHLISIAHPRQCIWLHHLPPGCHTSSRQRCCPAQLGSWAVGQLWVGG